MKKLLWVSFLFLSLTQAYGQSWSLLNSGSSSNLKGVHFPTATVGYACGDAGEILKTTDGGSSWTSLTTSFPGYWFWDIHFVNVDTGYVVGESDPGFNPSGLGIVLKTLDGGSSWTTLMSGLSTPPRDLFVLDKDTVFICGGAEQVNSRIAKSYDGGATWTQIGIPEMDAIEGGIYFLNGNVGFLGMYIFTFGGYFLNSTDGSSFTSSLIPSSGGYWNFATDFGDQSTGYFMRSTYGSSDPVYVRKTIDAGGSWNESQVAGFGGSIYGLDFVDADNGYMVGGSGKILHTSNGNSSWSTQSSGTTNDLHSVCFVNTDLGFAVGNNGTILKYTNLVGLSDNASSPTIQIYPNPADEIINVETEEKIDCISIVNVLGETVGTYRNKSAIAVDRLQKGTYTMSLIFASGKQVQKLFIKN
ncbi:MAG: YCF48-related protein [Bacteroidota bacterium]